MDVLCTDKTGTLTESRIELVHHLDAGGNDSRRRVRARLSQQRLRKRHQEPARRSHPGSRQASRYNRWHKVDEVPFDFERRRVSVLLDDGRNTAAHRQGAPEDIIALSTHRRRERRSSCRSMTPNGARFVGRFEQLGAERLPRSRRRLAAHGAGARERHRRRRDGPDVRRLSRFRRSAQGRCGTRSIEALAAAGVEVKILTGDNERITQHVCNRSASR